MIYTGTLFIKFGIGRATYSTSQEIRNGEINRDEGISLVGQFDGNIQKDLKKKIFNTFQ